MIGDHFVILPVASSLAILVRLVEGKMTGVFECLEMLYTSHHMYKR